MMSENNKSYRIHTKIGQDKVLNVQLNQDYDIFEILSLKIDTEDLYKLHSSNYGCIVGRVVANGGVGVPNVKISMFIPSETNALEDPIMSNLYPYGTTKDKNIDNIRYNLLPADQISDCHQNIGTFPGKRLVLDDNVVLEMFDNYYKFTTVTNASGDYILFGVPTGNTMIHSDLDLSDIGFLSQKPRDLLYKGYNITQFENANMFKKDTNLDNLTQVISQDSSVYVYPFWGDSSEGEIKITRNDIEVSYKFQPTCVFMGSVFSDERSQGISKRCIPTDRMGKMDRLTTGQGTIEMIRKTPDGDVEPCIIEGNQLVDGNGTWCYQIPMNLDYMTTDEYGNLVPTDDINKGIPTRTRARFRLSLSDYESDFISPHLVKVLIPNNPEPEYVGHVDYAFGTATRDDSYKDLFWNNIYSVKSYIPRIQKGINYRNKNFTGIKAVNVNGANNPMPYNNMRVNLTFLFSFQCILFKILLRLIAVMNKIIRFLNLFSSKDKTLVYLTLDGNMCKAFECIEPLIDTRYDIHIEQFYIAPGVKHDNGKGVIAKSILNTIKYLQGGEINIGGDGKEKESVKPKDEQDPRSIEDNNSQFENTEATTQHVGLVNHLDYFKKCVELQFAMEYEVIQFDFYNDWINGAVYIPRWFAEIKKRKINKDYKEILKACNEQFTYPRNLVQQCALAYNGDGKVQTSRGCDGLTPAYASKSLKCHKKVGIKKIDLNKGIVHQETTNQAQYVYYLRPCDNNINNDDKISKKKNLFATDIILLGSLDNNNIFGIPVMKKMSGSSYLMPPPTAQIVSDSQEMSLSAAWQSSFNNGVSKWHDFDYINGYQPTDTNGTNTVEISGIDWGYNPFSDKYQSNNFENDYKEEDNQSKDTIDLPGGHFLEIGCTNSAVNSRACINLQRICEVGSTMSQTHEYEVNPNVIQTIGPTGFISKREITDYDVRRQISILNSNNLTTVVDNNTYLRYEFIPYMTSNFDGAFAGYPLDSNTPSTTYKEEQKDNSYIKYRYGHGGLKFLIKSGNFYYLPQYENSFYFYFGLSDGNTAIDRLYKNYFNECPKLVIPTNERIFTLQTDMNKYIQYVYNRVGEANPHVFATITTGTTPQEVDKIELILKNNSEESQTVTKLTINGQTPYDFEPLIIGAGLIGETSVAHNLVGNVMVNGTYVGTLNYKQELGYEIIGDDEDQYNFTIKTIGTLTENESGETITKGLVHVMGIMTINVVTGFDDVMNMKSKDLHFWLCDDTLTTEYTNLISNKNLNDDYRPYTKIPESIIDYIKTTSNGYDDTKTVCQQLNNFANLQTIYDYKQCLVQKIDMSFYVGETINGVTYHDIHDALDPYITYGEKIKDVNVKSFTNFPGYEIISNTDNTFKVNTYGWYNNTDNTISCTGFCYTIAIINVVLNDSDNTELHFYIFDDHTQNINNPYMEGLTGYTSITHNEITYYNYKNYLKHENVWVESDDVSSAFTTTLTDQVCGFSNTTVYIQNNNNSIIPSGTKKLICKYGGNDYYWGNETGHIITQLSIDFYTGIVPNNAENNLNCFLGNKGKLISTYSFD